MGSSVDQVVTKFRRIYPDCGSSRAGEIFADVHREILVRLRLREKTVSINLTDGTKEYDLGDTSLLVMGADYIKSATDGDFINLSPTSVDHLDYDDPSWRARLGEGDPTQYYLRNVESNDTSKQVIGFLPIPDTTTSAGYPIVRVYCHVEGTITTSETVPPQLLSDDIYTTTMAHKYAREKDHKRVDFWEKESEKEFHKNTIHIKNRVERLDTQVISQSHGFMSPLT
jgi:hypothetical protein